MGCKKLNMASAETENSRKCDPLPVQITLDSNDWQRLTDVDSGNLIGLIAVFSFIAIVE